jgi:hypothetical protein
MYVPAHVWPKVEVVAYDADGIGAHRDDDLENPEHYGDQLDEISLGDYPQKARASQSAAMRGAMSGPDIAQRNKQWATYDKRKQGLARAEPRVRKANIAAADQALKDKYAGIDIDAEIARLMPSLEQARSDAYYGGSNTYSQGEAQYQSLAAQMQELRRAKKLLSQGVEEDAVADFLARGGQIQQGKLHKPRKSERWQGSSHIGAAGGQGTKGRVSGMAANTNTKSGKPVVTAEEELDEISKQKLGDYLHAAHQNVVDRASSSSFQSGQAGDRYNRADVSPKERQRQAGMSRAVQRLTREGSSMAEAWATRYPNINADIAECKSAGDHDRANRLTAIKNIIDADLSEQSGLGFGE